MAEKLYNQAMRRQNFGRPPVWFMRQAGRYHGHYQNLRAEYSFVDVCKKPEVAAEATMGPIQDFDFDAAILFSDILFPLEVLGVPLDYNPGPQLGFLLRDDATFAKLKGDPDVAELGFQRKAIDRIRERLPDDKALIGFVGAPLTLYYFGVEGSHKKALDSARSGLTDGRWQKFCDHMLPLLIANMKLQAEGAIDAMAMFDTCAGDLSQEQYEAHVIPVLKQVMEAFKKEHGSTRLIYYSKGTGPEHWDKLDGLPIDCLGVDWHHDLVEVLSKYGERYAIQGNFDPDKLRDLSTADLEKELRAYFAPLQALKPEQRKGWVCGLGHGVLPKTPEENVRLFLRLQKELFGTD